MKNLGFLLIITTVVIVGAVCFQLGVDYSNTKIEQAHKCSDSTHKMCIMGYCDCDGMECIIPAFGTSPRVYQIDDIYDEDHCMLYVYDGERLVDSLNYDSDLGKIILKDNE